MVTLIELLAVIVILSIIALIATALILNVMNMYMMFNGYTATRGYVKQLWILINLIVVQVSQLL